MKTSKRIPKNVRAQAQNTISLTLTEAAALPGALGKLVPLELRYHGYYAVIVGGIKTLYIRVDG